MEIVETHQPIKVKVHGEPFFDYPADLFIPPDYLDLLLEEFEGPLDLLLYIIRKKNFDICSLPISEITEQYLTYLQLCLKSHRELAIDYLCMASTLIALKARMMLPKPRKTGSDEQEEIDPRQELADKLKAYAQCQAQAKGVDALNRVGRDFWDCGKITCESPLPVVKQYPLIADLKKVYEELALSFQQRLPHEIRSEQYPTEEAIQALLDCIPTHGISFKEFLESFQRPLQWGLSSFLAILELRKQHRIEILQQQSFESIYLTWMYDHEFSDL